MRVRSVELSRLAPDRNAPHGSVCRTPTEGNPPPEIWAARYPRYCMMPPPQPRKTYWPPPVSGQYPQTPKNHPLADTRHGPPGHAAGHGGTAPHRASYRHTISLVLYRAVSCQASLPTRTLTPTPCRRLCRNEFTHAIRLHSLAALNLATICPAAACPFAIRLRSTAALNLATIHLAMTLRYAPGNRARLPRSAPSLPPRRGEHGGPWRAGGGCGGRGGVGGRQLRIRKCHSCAPKGAFPHTPGAALSPPAAETRGHSRPRCAVKLR